MNFHHKNFDLTHLKVLYTAAIGHEAMIKQWSDMEDWGRAAEYATKCEAVVELMESITVFNLGDGLSGFDKPMGSNHRLSQRLHSFDKLFPKKERTR